MACACCAREKRRVKLEEVVFPPKNSVLCPPCWGYSAEEWTKHGSQWFEAVEGLFDIERYLEQAFSVSERLKDAAEEVEQAQEQVASAEASVGGAEPEEVEVEAWVQCDTW